MMTETHQVCLKPYVHSSNTSGNGDLGGHHEEKLFCKLVKKGKESSISLAFYTEPGALRKHIVGR